MFNPETSCSGHLLVQAEIQESSPARLRSHSGMHWSWTHLPAGHLWGLGSWGKISDKKRGQCCLALHLKTDVVGPHWDVLAVSQHSMERRAHQKQMIWWANNTVHLQGFSRQGSPYIGYVSIALFMGYVDILCIWTSSYTPILPIVLSIYWLEYWNICFGKDPPIVMEPE